MKKIFFTGIMILLGITAFSQKEETNGTIYIRHPYIDVVNNANKAYEAQDWGAMKNMFADTARWWVSGMAKFIPVADAMNMWKSDFDKYDDVKQVQFGYPDYLHYKKDDGMTVQSWWTWSGKSKKTGEVLSVPMVQFDDFNKDGKITREYIFGDFSKMEQ